MQALNRWLGTLRFPVLLMLAAGLLLVNLLVPDPLPFVDEALLALVTLLLGRIKRPLPAVKEPDDVS